MRVILEPQNDADEIFADLFWKGKMSIEYDPSIDQLKFASTDACIHDGERSSLKKVSA